MAYPMEHGRKTALPRPVSVVEGVYDLIYQRLVLLEIAPGARIPIDVMARELETSQTPVREALSRLEREGLVRKAHLIGYSAAPQLTRKQFEDIYAFRLMLEPEGAKLAARNMTPAKLATIEASASDMDASGPPVDRSSRYSRFARADGHFHDAIQQIAGNEISRHALASQHIHLHIFRLLFHVRVTQEALEEHESLLTAFRCGDDNLAEAAMREHLHRSYERLLPAFD
jgi:DNA-binding GntR family transcriptional regulator